ncbi:MAG: hypothetical protein GPJ50_03390 [Candidatus Heimdallarchaeota archaeon]|nr:hypothetical protein [Candidatus Heimdallarchaeota archaeon]
MVLFDRRHWHKDYFETIEKGSVDKDSITDWEYEWAGLSFPDGYHPQSILIGGRRAYKP